MQINKYIRIKLRTAFNLFFRPHFYAGEKAETLFADQARLTPWILEKIEQSQDSFGQYQILKGQYTKRGDYLCRQLPKIEIEVKCLNKYSSEFGEFFYISWRHWQRHQNQIKALGLDDIVFAIYERVGSQLMNLRANQ